MPVPGLHKGSDTRRQAKMTGGVSEYTMNVIFAMTTQ